MSVGREAVDRLGSAFLSGDVEAVLDEFVAADDVLYAGSEVGEVAVGRSALRALLEELMSREERYSWEAGTVHEVDTGARVHVVADTELTVHVGGPGPSDGWRPGERSPYRVSGVLEREPGATPVWRWRCCLGSEPVVASAG